MHTTYNMWQKFLIHYTFWYLAFQIIKIEDKPIKSLEMRAKIKSIRKINEIFLCIFTYIWKSDIFSTFLNFDKKYFFDYFKSQISKCIIYKKLLPHVIRHMHPSGRNDKLTLRFFHYQTPCNTKVHLNKLVYWTHCRQKINHFPQIWNYINMIWCSYQSSSCQKNT